MSEIEGRVGELLDQAAQAPKGPSKIALLREAVRLADSINDLDLGMEVRREIIDEGPFCGAAEDMLVAFSWCLAQCDKDPERFDETDLFWSFKWVGDRVWEFPKISRQRCEAVLDDMERRYTRQGYSLRPVYKLRCEGSIEFGEPDKASKFYELWLKTPKDWNNDCRACEANSEAWLALNLGDYPRAKKLAAPLLKPKGLRCSEVPHITYCRMALPALQGGEGELAKAYAAEGYRLCKGNPEFLPQMGWLMAYFGQAGELAEGLKLFEKHAGWTLTSGTPQQHFRFWWGARTVIGRAALAAKGKKAALRFPREFEIWNNSARYDWTELAGWMDAKLDDLAGAFDARNGNDRYMKEVQAARA